MKQKRKIKIKKLPGTAQLKKLLHIFPPVLMPPGSRCDFNLENDFCGWKDPIHFSLSKSEHQTGRAVWQKRKGRTALDGIKGDLSQKNDGDNY